MSDRVCLIVDDEPAIRTFLRAILEPLQLRTIEAENASQALKTIQSLHGRLDLLLSDVKMPGDLDGIDLAHSVRHQCPGIPIILISGFCDKAVAASAGFELIAKPFVVETIVKAVERALNPVVPRS